VLQELLSEITVEVTKELYDHVMDRNASHVVRQLLCVISGENLVKGKSKGHSKSESSRGKVGINALRS
jgi:hypothetical protein